MKLDVQQIDFLDPKLRQIILYLEDLFGVEFTNTSNYRPDGVHKWGRGFDIHCNYDPFGRMIEETVNSLYQYDPARPEMKCCLYHGSPKHVHLQTHPNTRLR